MDEIGEGAKKKVPVNHQHTRLQKEGEDESWISGEELKTDGSSDEDDPTKIKHNKRLKKRPVKPRNLPSNAGAISEEELDKKPKLKQEDRRSSSHNVTESLNLEHNWRPKRGSLKLPNLIDGSHYAVDKESCAIKENWIGDGWVKERGKKIDEVQKSIAELEKAIVENTDLFKVEKCERLKTQEQLCSEISQSKDNDCGLFMDLCHFERSSSPIDGVIDNEVSNSEKLSEMKTTNKNFIKRNIELAAKMTNLSLTDEEKQKLDHLLENIDIIECGENGGSVSSDELEDCDGAPLNVFCISDKEREKLNEIDNKLMALHDSELRPGESQVFPPEESSDEPSEVDQ